MTHFVRVVNGEVKDVWDTAPQEGVGNNGWRNAVEVRPSIQAGRQGYTAHRFDLNTDPVQIIWDTYEISVEERKAGMKANAGFEFQQVVNQMTRNPETLDAQAIEAAKQVMIAKQAAIDAASTHDELDTL